jgi:hypothetical protein
MPVDTAPEAVTAAVPACNPRTHGSHDPVAWKYHHVGNYLLNGALPPNHGQI